MTKPSALPEADVIRGARGGDERMYRELVGRYLRPALAVAWEFVETIEDAEDVVQEAFRRAVDALDRFDVRRPFAPWFFTILRNVARSTGGRRLRGIHHEEGKCFSGTAPTGISSGRSTIDSVHLRVCS